MEEVVTKICRRCKRELPLTKFSRSNTSSDKLKGECKECRHDRYLISTPNTKRKKISNKPGYKICNKCDIEKSIDEFYIYEFKPGKTRPFHICKECHGLYYEKNVKGKGTCIDCGKPIHPNSTRCNKCAPLKTIQDPDWIKHHQEAMKKRSGDPEYLKRNREMVSRLSQDPSWIYNNKIGAMRRALDPDWILHSAQAALKRSEDPIWYENVLKIRNGQGIWYGHPVVSTTRLERIKQYYKTPIGRESQIRKNHKRRATEAKLKTKEQDSFWKMTPQRIERIIKRQNGMCPMCGDPLGEHYHRDHIIPLHLEGRNGNPNPWCPGLVRGNVQILHKGCNSKKHNSWNISRAINEMLVDIV